MIKKREIHLEGFIYEDEEDENIELWNVKKEPFVPGRSFIDLIQAIIQNIDEDYEIKPSTLGEYNEDMGGESYLIPNVKLAFYISSEKISLEESKQHHLIQTIGGDLDALGECYGHSEFSIEGLCVKTLSIGGHELYEELKTYEEKYVHILIEY